MCCAVALPSAGPQQPSQAKAPYTIKAANGVYDMTAASRKQVRGIANAWHPTHQVYQHVLRLPSKQHRTRKATLSHGVPCAQEDGDLDEDDESGWETASDEDEEAHFDASAVSNSTGGETAVREAPSAQDTTQVPMKTTLQAAVMIFAPLHSSLVKFLITVSVFS